MMLFADVPMGAVLATTTWGSINSWSLISLPLFIWMGEILFRSNLAEDMFEGLAPWLVRLPGGLLHVNILGCGLFAAVSGSSAVTAATIGRMSLPELEKRGYDEKMRIGTLAGAGTVGFLIPPSIILIIYGVAIEESITRLFAAGVLPGLMLIILFMGYTIIWATIYPSKIPDYEKTVHWKTILVATRKLTPVFLLITGIIGSIYAGIASPTDAAAVGVLLSLVLSAVSGTLNKKTFYDGLMNATSTSCMIAFILVGSAFLSTAMGFSGLPRALAEQIGSLGLSPYSLIAILTLFFIVLGCFLDGISIVVLTTVVLLPLVESVGLDRVWFGIYLVLVVEMSQITPPVGFNLFVIQSLTDRDIFWIARAAFPFFILLVVAVAAITIFPEIVTFLPNRIE